MFKTVHSVPLYSLDLMNKALWSTECMLLPEKPALLKAMNLIIALLVTLNRFLLFYGVLRFDSQLCFQPIRFG